MTNFGKIGIWVGRQAPADTARHVEELGYGALWIGRSPSIADVKPFLEASQRIPIASGILNVWQHEPADVAREFAEADERFVLGIGIGHPEATSDYSKPLTTLRNYLDGLDAGSPPVPKDRRLLAALAPKTLALSAERTLGTHPYFTTPDHTRFARETVGPDALVAPELTVVLEPDREVSRPIAREFASRYLRLRNYTANLLRFDFTEADVRDGGSDRLVDAVVAQGDAQAIAEAVHAHLDAGADHVCLQPLGHGDAPVDDYRALAEVLLS